ncbi:MAG: ATP-binding domain-containing protein [Deltaproteobacteria bacterium]|nr:ATP-binding domain-containing protein [Deltaproteobacteria bacterium]MBN2674214.1 ATP-binding domain-containing protein [Deltaproteobacteria bacterium]
MSEDSKIKEIVQEEQALLSKVVVHLTTSSKKTSTFADYDAELIELRDAIAEALPEDVPSLVEQMTRLQAIAAQRGLGEDVPVDPGSPYFGHMQLDEDGEVRDVLLGKRTYISPADGIRIVDWRNAPVSRMYYCYEEGDEYEESFGGKFRSGTISSRRSVTITQGQLKRVDCPFGTLVNKGEDWIRLRDAGAKLAGGQGSSVRGKKTGKLGVDANGDFRKDKHLPEISALLDKEQFALISSDHDELLAVQGSAGSGKTTVGLHRIAYLAYSKTAGLKPGNMVIIVLNSALASYIADVLPALGVRGVKVWTFENWCSRLRKKHVRGLPAIYSEWTPSIVSRVKKHPALLRILEEWVDMQDEAQSEKLLQAVHGYADAHRVEKAWKILHRMPLDVRRKRLLRWLDGEVRIGNDHGDNIDMKTAIALDSALQRMAEVSEDIVEDWADLFTDKRRLIHMFDMHAPAEFTEEELARVHQWCTDSYKKIFDEMDDSDEPVDEDDRATLDREDDAILLRLYQLKKGWLREGGRRIEYDHMMVDEVQDFSALEVKTLIDTVGRNRPITLAGDTAQKIVREGGFDDWDSFMDDLGVQGARLEPLKIAYRSTIEVMEVARDVLGPLAGEDSVATRHGAPVEVHQFSDPGQAVDFLGTSLRELFLREPLSNVAVIARHANQAKLYYQGLKKSEIPNLRLVLEQDFSFTPGIEVTEIRQVKGLEFDYVIMVECNDDSYPLTDEARHLMHVGMTRAAHQLWLITTATPSALIPKNLL